MARGQGKADRIAGRYANGALVADEYGMEIGAVAAPRLAA